MERYSQFRDKGTSIAPFLPVPSPPSSALWLPISIFLFLIRLPFVISLSVLYFGVLESVAGLLPAGLGGVLRYAVLWGMLGVTGVWWVDLQVDGVRRGQLHSASSHLPGPGSIIASSFTSPLDPLYLAGIFQPVFTRSYPSSRLVERISLFRAILLAFSPPAPSPPDRTKLVTLKELSIHNPGKIICVFPETSTTNGRGILPLCSSLLSASAQTKIYPVNLRYTPQDITTPVPGNYAGWLWKLLHTPSHQMRVRIASAVFNSANLDKGNQSAAASGYDTNIFDTPEFRNGHGLDGEEGEFEGVKVQVGDSEADDGARMDAGVSATEQRILDRVAEDLARLGRVKRVGLGVEEKIKFLEVWGKRKR